ncbi:MAG: UDP-N-acetylmuramoyl-tripeptide--D-alanyl-D-alanine ligase [Firmicutes bacterium]|nr:UDP-N-acetylmuramoyl-tripeptide--D-alanyl-D-alanine ligase [Candidatus Colimorpha enterica]
MKKDILTAAFVASSCGGEIIRDGGAAHGIAIDSRKVEKGNIFAAIAGENTDGHNSIRQSLEKGAGGIICEKVPEGELPGDGFVVKVENTVKALGAVAKAYRSLFGCPFVGVTGSVGKTTTRTLIRSVLAAKYVTYGTEGNFNNELGLPISLLSFAPDIEAGVYELGMGVKGDIDMLSKILSPTVGVITNIGTAHIEFLGSRENIRDAKMEIAANVREGGKLILNGDEPLLSGVEGAVYCALENKNADYYVENIRFTPEGMLFDVKGKGGETKDILLPAFGEQLVLDSLFAYAVGDLCGIDHEKIKEGISSYEPVGMRQKIVRKDGGCFILDYYNASPESMRTSYDVAVRLAENCGGRAVCVFGSVLEEGEHAEELHRSVGRYIAGGCGLLATFGDDAAYIADEAVKCGMKKENVAVFRDIEDPDALSDYLLENLKSGDCVIFKASHGIRLGRVADRVLSGGETK